MKKLIALSCIACVSLLGACSDNDNNTSNDPQNVFETSARGDLCGFVVDAKSSQRIANATVWTIFNGSVRVADMLRRGDLPSDAPQLAGGYCFRNMPLHVNFVVWAEAEGYASFTSRPVAVALDNVEELNSESGTAFFNEDDRTMIRNVALYPSAETNGVSYNYTIVTQVGDEPVANTDVRCVADYASDNAFNPLQSVNTTNTIYLEPTNTFAPIVAQTTDASGAAVFPGSTLTKGVTYSCFAHRSDLVGGVVVGNFAAVASFTVGVTQNTQVLELNAEGEDLEVVFTNASAGLDQPVGLDNPITYLFNRNVTVQTPDCIEGTVTVGLPFDSGANTPDVPDTIEGNGVSEAVSISGDNSNQLSLSPIYDADARPNPQDRNVTFQFTNLFVKPSDALNSATLYVISVDTASSIEPVDGSTVTCGDLAGAANALSTTTTAVILGN